VSPFDADKPAAPADATAFRSAQLTRETPR
jgi:hypothetical protein